MRFFISGFLVVIGLLGGFYYFINQDFYNKPNSADQTLIPFEVETGLNFNEMSKQLEVKGLIRDHQLFNLVARMKNFRSKIKSGEYLLKASMSPKEIFQILMSGKSVLHTFTVSEGLNIYEVGLAYEKQGYGKKEIFLDACFDKELLKRVLDEDVYSCEGYLFPETYAIDKKTSASHLVEHMMHMFLKKYAEATKDLNLVGWSRQKIVTLASIIEKETGVPEERPLISAVFHNRIKQKMKLQTDPTVLYGILDKTKSYRGNITKKDLITPNPYNTYTNVGLPVGPIANPGADAIKSVFKPAESEYLFFVSKNDGTHVFSKTYQEHEKRVAQFQLDRKAKEGKSWRDYSKKHEEELKAKSAHK